MSKHYDQIVMKRAKAVWEVMHREARNRGMALTKDHTYGDGRIIINTVGAFIKGLNKERGWDLDQNQIDLVRRYLKASGNVVVKSKVEQYKFRIFIREEWNDGLLVTEPIGAAKHARADKISPHDAGEDREPAPVEYKCAECKRIFPSQQALASHKGAHTRAAAQEDDISGSTVISEIMARAMRFLDSVGGEVTSKSGLTTAIIRRGIGNGVSVKSLSNSIAGLEGRGWITRAVKGKRTYKVAVTKEGYEALEDLDRYRHARHVLEDHLRRVYRVDRRESLGLYETIARDLGISEHRVGSALRTLEDEGLVVIERPKTQYSEEGYPESVYWARASEAIQPIARKALGDEPQGTEGQDRESYSVEITAGPEPLEGDLDEVKKKRLGWMSDQVLVDELAKRLAQPSLDPQLVEKLSQAEQTLDLIADLIREVNEGKIVPLKALGEIEAALDLGGSTPLSKANE